MVTGGSFPLESLPAAVTACAATWATPGLSWHVHPVEPNHGKAVIIGEFESDAPLGDMLVWITGDAQLETIPLADGRTINKHHDLTHMADLNVQMDDLVALVVEDRVALAAVVIVNPHISHEGISVPSGADYRPASRTTGGMGGCPIMFRVIGRTAACR